MEISEEQVEVKNNGWPLLLGLAAAVVSVGAGIYLLTSESASAETTVFDALMHGIGAYFVAKGLWMLQSLARSGSLVIRRPKVPRL